MGKWQFQYLKDNKAILGPKFEELGLSIDKILEEIDDPTYLDWHEQVTAPLNGYVDAADYLRKAAPYDRIPLIKRPVMFMNAINDPFLQGSLDYEVFKQNENTVLATNKYPGHMGYHEKLFSLD